MTKKTRGKDMSTTKKKTTKRTAKRKGSSTRRLRERLRAVRRYTKEERLWEQFVTASLIRVCAGDAIRGADKVLAAYRERFEGEQ
jgi:hypothetical protein